MNHLELTALWTSSPCPKSTPPFIRKQSSVLSVKRACSHHVLSPLLSRDGSSVAADSCTQARCAPRADAAGWPIKTALWQLFCEEGQLFNGPLQSEWERCEKEERQFYTLLFIKWWILQTTCEIISPCKKHTALTDTEIKFIFFLSWVTREKEKKSGIYQDLKKKKEKKHY